MLRAAAWLSEATRRAGSMYLHSTRPQREGHFAKLLPRRNEQERWPRLGDFQLEPGPGWHRLHTTEVAASVYESDFAHDFFPEAASPRGVLFRIEGQID